MIDREWREDRFDKISGMWVWLNIGGWGKEIDWGWCLSIWFGGVKTLYSKYFYMRLYFMLIFKIIYRLKYGSRCM